MAGSEPIEKAIKAAPESVIRETLDFIHGMAVRAHDDGEDLDAGKVRKAIANAVIVDRWSTVTISGGGVLGKATLTDARGDEWESPDLRPADRDAYRVTDDNDPYRFVVTCRVQGSGTVLEHQGTIEELIEAGMIWPAEQRDRFRIFQTGGSDAAIWDRKRSLIVERYRSDDGQYLTIAQSVLRALNRAAA